MPKSTPVKVRDEDLLFRLIRASFNQRRKTLYNGLKNDPNLSFSKETITAAIGELGKDSRIRGEELTLAEFARLSDIFTTISIPQ